MMAGLISSFQMGAVKKPLMWRTLSSRVRPTLLTSADSGIADVPQVFGCVSGLGGATLLLATKRSHGLRGTLPSLLLIGLDVLLDGIDQFLGRHVPGVRERLDGRN